VQLVMRLATQTMALGCARAALDRRVPPGRLVVELMNVLKETGAFTGRPWGEAVRKWASAAPHWSREAIDDALNALLDADVALKESRVSTEEQVLSTLALVLCGAGTRRRAA